MRKNGTVKSRLEPYQPKVKKYSGGKRYASGDQMTLMCEHVYKSMGVSLCPKCGLDTHDTNWDKQNNLMKQWHIDNPDAKYAGWMSI